MRRRHDQRPTQPRTGPRRTRGRPELGTGGRSPLLLSATTFFSPAATCERPTIGWSGRARGPSIIVRARSPALFAVAAAAGLGAPMSARAGESSPPIVGGAPAARCDWPSAVLLFDAGLLCTGTLVHPRIVLYAAHCGVDFTRVEFGERLGTGYVADVTECRRATTSDRVSPMDYAYCELARPVDGVPI